MGRTDRFKQDHAELVKLVGEMSKLLVADALAKDGRPVRTLLSRLTANIKLHLATEDQNLYPALTQSPDPKVKELAKKFMGEMGGIRTAFEEYVKRWPSGEAISANPQGFIKETKDVFAVLAKRIERENNELYPMADKIAA